MWTYRELGRNQFLTVTTTAAVTTELISHVATLGLMLGSNSVRAATHLGR